jgi:hypothetical protein
MKTRQNVERNGKFQNALSLAKLVARKRSAIKREVGLEHAVSCCRCPRLNGDA